MNKKEKPVDATTAVATDHFNDPNQSGGIHAKKNAENIYIGDDGDRLFTRDEVTTIIRVRQERFTNGLLKKYGLSNLEELDHLVMLADKVNDAVNEYHNSNAYVSRERKAEEKQLNEFIELLETIGNWDYVSISKIQRYFEWGFVRAGKLFGRLEMDRFIVKNETLQKYFPNKEAIADFISKNR